MYIFLICYSGNCSSMILYFQIMYKYKIQEDGQVGRVEYTRTKYQPKQARQMGYSCNTLASKKGRRVEECASNAKGRRIGRLLVFVFLLLSVFVFADDGNLNGVLHLPSQRPRYTTPFLIQDRRRIQHNRGRMLGDIAGCTKDEVPLNEGIGKADLEITLFTPRLPSDEIENRIVTELGGDIV